MSRSIILDVDVWEMYHITNILTMRIELYLG